MHSSPNATAYPGLLPVWKWYYVSLQHSSAAAAAAATHVSSEPSFSKMRIAIVGALPVVLLQAKEAASCQTMLLYGSISSTLRCSPSRQHALLFR